MACSGASCSGLPVLGKGVSCAPRVSRASRRRLPSSIWGACLPGIVPRPHQAVSSMMVGIRTTADEIRRVGGIADALVLRLLGIRAERPGESRGLGRVLGRMRRQRLVRCRDSISGATPSSTHRCSARIASCSGSSDTGTTSDCPKLTAPAPPRQWFIPGTMKSRSNSCTRFNPPLAASLEERRQMARQAIDEAFAEPEKDEPSAKEARPIAPSTTAANGAILSMRGS